MHKPVRSPKIPFLAHLAKYKDATGAVTLQINTLVKLSPIVIDVIFGKCHINICCDILIGVTIHITTYYVSYLVGNTWCGELVIAMSLRNTVQISSRLVFGPRCPSRLEGALVRSAGTHVDQSVP